MMLHFCEPGVGHAALRSRDALFVAANSTPEEPATVVPVTTHKEAEKCGLDATALEELTLLSRHWRRGSLCKESTMCVICQQNFRLGESYRALPCEHCYHPACIDPWLSKSRSCPLCKGDVLLTKPTQAVTEHMSLNKRRLKNRIKTGLQRSHLFGSREGEPLRKTDLGVAVRRGPDWQWGEQDGNGIGVTIPGCVLPGWTRVLWSNGFENNYCTGHRGRHDVVRCG
mmetsp:Transcript_23249/g.51013  ORF Transcript_23249/g.51013 Transcript_23249/m.51013 type:complete len:227 (-) Transcript_23249:475-1155(-)